VSVVLIADDDAYLRDMYTMRLVREGFTVHQAIDGQEVIEQAEKLHPDIVLLDVMMPKMNGLDALKLLKSGEKTKDIPVIIMTALAQDLSQVNDAAQKAEGYISKPDVLPDQVVEQVKKVLEQGSTDSAKSKDSQKD